MTLVVCVTSTSNTNSDVTRLIFCIVQCTIVIIGSQSTYIALTPIKTPFMTFIRKFLSMPEAVACERGLAGCVCYHLDYL